jgi:acetyl esterase/lipase
MRAVSAPFADARLEAFVKESSAPFAELDVDVMRRGIARRSRMRSPGPRMHAVSELNVAGRAARHYLPIASPEALVLYLHGGGWTVGDLESHDRMCRRLAERSGLGVMALCVRRPSGWGLDAETVRFFISQWVPDPGRRSDPAVSPLFAADLSGLPKTVIVSAEHDPLRDESEAYARRLGKAGVEVELRREPGMIHNFMLLDEVSPACSAGCDRVAHDLRTHLTR